jgi:hypothetical protein
MSDLLSILGIKTQLVPIEKNELRGLNVDLLLRFDCYSAEFNNRKLCVIQSKHGTTFTPLKYRKITEYYERITGLPVAVILESLPYRERERLICQSVYFIVSDKYAFLPSIVANVRIKEKSDKPTGLTPPAQYLLLHYLLNINDLPNTIRDLEKILPYNYLSIARAVVNLENLQLCKTTTDQSGTKLIDFDKNKRTLWEKARRYLSSPVKKILYSDYRPEGCFRTSGINALAHYSHLNTEQSETFAIWDRDFACSEKEYDETEGVFKIEVWKYPVSIPFQPDNQFVDKLSLYLSLMSEHDARIEKELEFLIENMEW